MMLEYVVLAGSIIVLVVIFYGIIVIHDIPYKIAVTRNHPHQDVLHVAGWVSLFTLHAIWPFLWIWAMLYHEDRGWGMETSDDRSSDRNLLIDRLEAMEKRISDLETGKGE